MALQEELQEFSLPNNNNNGVLQEALQNFPVNNHIEYTGLSETKKQQVKTILRNNVQQIECVMGCLPTEYGFEDDNHWYPAYRKITGFVVWKKKIDPGHVGVWVVPAHEIPLPSHEISQYRQNFSIQVAKILAIQVIQLPTIIEKIHPAITPAQSTLVQSYIEECVHKTIMTIVRASPQGPLVIPQGAAKKVYFPIGHGSELWKAPRSKVPANSALVTRTECLIPTYQGTTGFEEIQQNILQKKAIPTAPIAIEAYYADIPVHKGVIKQKIFGGRKFGYYPAGKEYPNLLVTLYLTTSGPVPNSMNLYQSGLRSIDVIHQTRFQPIQVELLPHVAGQPQQVKCFICGVELTLPMVYFFGNVIPQMYSDSIYPTRAQVQALFLNLESYAVSNIHIFKGLQPFEHNRSVLGGSTLEQYFSQQINASAAANREIYLTILQRLGMCLEFIVFYEQFFQSFPGTHYHLVCRGAEGPLTQAAGPNVPALVAIRQLSNVISHQGGTRVQRRHKKRRQTKKRK